MRAFGNMSTDLLFVTVFEINSTDRGQPTKAKFKLLYLSSNLYAFSLQNDHLHALLVVHKFFFYFKMGLKGAQNSHTFVFGRYFEFLIFHPIWCSFFFNKVIIFMCFWILCYFILKRDIKCPNSEILHTFFFLYLEDIFNTWNSKTRQMSKIQYVQQITVYSTLRWQARYCFHTCF